MDYKDELLNVIKKHEGFSSSVYPDSLGYWTLGYGFCVDKRKNCGITEEEASYILNNQLSEAELQLQPYLWFTSLDKVRQGVLIELCFNIGLEGVLKFTQTIQAISNKDYNLAAKEMLNSLWCQQVGDNRANNMANRLKTGSYAS